MYVQVCDSACAQDSHMDGTILQSCNEGTEVPHSEGTAPPGITQWYLMGQSQTGPPATYQTVRGLPQVYVVMRDCPTRYHKVRGLPHLLDTVRGII